MMIRTPLGYSPGVDIHVMVSEQHEWSRRPCIILGLDHELVDCDAITWRQFSGLLFPFQVNITFTLPIQLNVLRRTDERRISWRLVEHSCLHMSPVMPLLLSKRF